MNFGAIQGRVREATLSLRRKEQGLSRAQRLALTAGAGALAFTGCTGGSATLPTAPPSTPPSPPPVTEPAATWLPAKYSSSRKGADIDVLLLHHTAGGLQSALSWVQEPDPEHPASWHYTVGRDGSLWQHVREQDKAWHAGKSELNGVPDVNRRSIGIELVNKGDGIEPFTEAQYEKLEELVTWLVVEYDVPPAHVLGHKDVALPKGRKIDPAANFDWERIHDAVDEVVG